MRTPQEARREWRFHLVSLRCAIKHGYGWMEETMSRDAMHHYARLYAKARGWRVTETKHRDATRAA